MNTMEVSVCTFIFAEFLFFSTNHRHVHGNKLSLSLQKFYRYSYEVEFMQNVIKDKITTEAKAFKSMLIFRPLTASPSSEY